jgi:hypothetical protein
MSYTPLFSYFLSPGESPVTPKSAIWRQPLPLSRHFLRENAPNSLSHGEYFSAARTFLENDGGKIIRRALARHLQQKLAVEDIQEIRIHLEKHGEFYHPACIEIPSDPHRIFFALNVAVSETGISTIKKEYASLSRLNHEFSPCFLPEVYGFGEVKSPGGRNLRMFLGHWFDGYHEFHISRDPSDGKDKILVWNSSRSPHYLSLEQSADLYRQAARILTYYYMVESFEQISSWHHGAGDFVAKIDRTGLDVKLISVRGYAPLFANLVDPTNDEMDPELILQTLLIFFLNLSVRMRLDRHDGVGELVWADSVAVKSTLDGFFEGLTLKPTIASLPDSIETCFRYYLSICTREDLYELGNVVMKTYHQRAPELRVIQQHLKDHVAELRRLVKHIL